MRKVMCLMVIRPMIIARLKRKKGQGRAYNKRRRYTFNVIMKIIIKFICNMQWTTNRGGNRILSVGG
jgi:hypothetical protein